MKNIEIKVTVPSFKDIIRNLKNLGADHKGKIDQVDIYFNSRSGRLKIREINKKQFELIYYQRSDKKSSRISQYNRVELDRDKSNLLKKIFGQSLGQKVVVKKIRDLWIYKNTRIHIDKIKGLGNFVELETVITGHNFYKFKNEHKKVLKALSLNRFEIQKQSYSDLLLRFISHSAAAVN